MEIEQIINLRKAESPQQLLEILESYEYSLDQKVEVKIEWQLFSYILNWDIVNARFFYYKYKNKFESSQKGVQIAQFLQLLYEQKYHRWNDACNRLCEILQNDEILKFWLNDLKKLIQQKLGDIVHKNFQSINANRLNTFNMKSNGENYIQIEQQKIEDQVIDIEKLTQVARLIQKMNIK